MTSSSTLPWAISIPWHKGLISGKGGSLKASAVALCEVRYSGEQAAAAEHSRLWALPSSNTPDTQTWHAHHQIAHSCFILVCRWLLPVVFLIAEYKSPVVFHLQQHWPCNSLLCLDGTALVQEHVWALPLSVLRFHIILFPSLSQTMGSERQPLFFTQALEMFIHRSGQQAHLATASRARRKKAEKREGRTVNLLWKYGEKKASENCRGS